jgi:hypothetical protein
MSYSPRHRSASLVRACSFSPSASRPCGTALGWWSHPAFLHPTRTCTSPTWQLSRAAAAARGEGRKLASDHASCRRSEQHPAGPPSFTYSESGFVRGAPARWRRPTATCPATTVVARTLASSYPRPTTRRDAAEPVRRPAETHFTRLSPPRSLFALSVGLRATSPPGFCCAGSLFSRRRCRSHLARHGRAVAGDDLMSRAVNPRPPCALRRLEPDLRRAAVIGPSWPDPVPGSRVRRAPLGLAMLIKVSTLVLVPPARSLWRGPPWRARARPCPALVAVGAWGVALPSRRSLGSPSTRSADRAAYAIPPSSRVRRLQREGVRVLPLAVLPPKLPFYAGTSPPPTPLRGRVGPFQCSNPGSDDWGRRGLGQRLVPRAPQPQRLRATEPCGRRVLRHHPSLAYAHGRTRFSPRPAGRPRLPAACRRQRWPALHGRTRPLLTSGRRPVRPGPIPLPAPRLSGSGRPRRRRRHPEAGCGSPVAAAWLAFLVRPAASARSHSSRRGSMLGALVSMVAVRCLGFTACSSRATREANWARSRCPADFPVTALPSRHRSVKVPRPRDETRSLL